LFRVVLYKRSHNFSVSRPQSRSGQSACAGAVGAAAKALMKRVALSRIWNRPSLWSRESRREPAQDVAIAWAYLIAAGLCEIGWPIGLKWTQDPGWTVLGTAMAVISLGISGGLLFLAQRDISLGTSYAVWTGIGAAGTFLVGVWFFGDPSSLGRWLGASLIIAGVITLKLAH
jgi:quaternary ammonium compound-resistance protein SugE